MGVARGVSVSDSRRSAEIVTGSAANDEVKATRGWKTFVVAPEDDLVPTFSGRSCPAQEVGGKDHCFPAGCMVGVARRRCLLRREGADTVGPKEASSTE